MRILFQRALREIGPNNNPEAIPPGRTSEELSRLLSETKDESEKRKLVKELRQVKMFDLKKNGNEQQKRVLETTEKFEDTKLAELLSLKNNGIFLYEYLLVDVSSSITPVKQESLKIGEKFEVNFGTNKSMRDSLGAGDILPPEVRSIEVNGKSGERREYPRPGYYDISKTPPVYLAIFDGDIIQIGTTQALSDDETKKYQEGQDNRRYNALAEVYLDAEILKKDPRESLKYLSDEEFIIVKNVAEDLREYYDARKKLFPPVKGREDFLREYGTYLNEVCEKTGINPEVMLRIFQKESNFTFGIDNQLGSSAKGIGQIIDSTWGMIGKRVSEFGFSADSNIPKNQATPRDEILYATVLVAINKKYRNGNLYEGLCDYVAGTGNDLDSMRSKNPSIAGKMKVQTVEEFRRCAVEEHFGFTKQDLENLTGYVPVEIPPSQKVTNRHPYETIEGLLSLDKTINPETGVTQCAATARLNAEYLFGVQIPQTPAPRHYARDTLSTYPTGQVASSLNNVTSDANMIDIVFENKTGHPAGHRALGLKGADGKWYVLDPYLNDKVVPGADNQRAVPYETYMNYMQRSKTLLGLGMWSVNGGRAEKFLAKTSNI